MYNLQSDNEDFEKPILSAFKAKLHGGRGTHSWRGSDQYTVCIIMQLSSEPHTDDNESLLVASSSIEPDPVSGEIAGAEAHCLYL